MAVGGPSKRGWAANDRRRPARKVGRSPGVSGFYIYEDRIKRENSRRNGVKLTIRKITDFSQYFCGFSSRNCVFFSRTWNDVLKFITLSAGKLSISNARFVVSSFGLRAGRWLTVALPSR